MPLIPCVRNAGLFFFFKNSTIESIKRNTREVSLCTKFFLQVYFIFLFFFLKVLKILFAKKKDFLLEMVKLKT